MSIDIKKLKYKQYKHIVFNTNIMNCIDPAINENEYIFTKEAWAFYQLISPIDKGSFWAYFLEEQFVAKGEIIYMSMIRGWFKNMDEHASLKRNLGQITQDAINTVNRDVNQISIIDMFNKPTHIYYKQQPVEIKYDMERATHVFKRVYEEIEKMVSFHYHKDPKDTVKTEYRKFTKALSDMEHQWNDQSVKIECEIYKQLLGCAD